MIIKIGSIEDAADIIKKSHTAWSSPGADRMAEYLFYMAELQGVDVNLNTTSLNGSFAEYKSELDWALAEFGDIYESLELPDGASEEVIKSSIREFINDEGGTILDIKNGKGLIIGHA
jgi:hypothetical protein